ncbi:MAG: dTDP-4-dehydrorhamnose reductase [Solirubrobacterales bacterium]|nr:dTDP-4-dehydrorhamnose reductase [Solirubrobacterales bacterium]
MTKLLVVGAGGMLGCDVLRAAESAGVDAVGLTHAELDVSSEAAVSAAIAKVQPDVVINCAAWTDVDGAESSEEAAFAINATAAGILANSGPRLVHVSTDYVFDGNKQGAYVESDPVAPQSAYGRTKLAGEQLVAAASADHAIARTAWLFGVDGANFVETMLRLAEQRGEVSVVDDQVGCPTWTAHLADALVELATNPASGGIHHVAGAGSTSWFGFAAAIFEATGTAVALSPTTSAEFIRPAPRPANSVLEATRPDTPRLPDWREGLNGYLAARPAAVRSN